MSSDVSHHLVRRNVVLRCHRGNRFSAQQLVNVHLCRVHALSLDLLTRTRMRYNKWLLINYNEVWLRPWAYELRKEVSRFLYQDRISRIFTFYMLAMHMCTQINSSSICSASVTLHYTSNLAYYIFNPTIFYLPFIFLTEARISHTLYFRKTITYFIYVLPQAVFKYLNKLKRQFCTFERDPPLQETGTGNLWKAWRWSKKSKHDIIYMSQQKMYLVVFPL